MTIKSIDPGRLRVEDPFVRKVAELFERHLRGVKLPPAGVRGYLAGGLAVRCYQPVRVTEDIDVFFDGPRVQFPPNAHVVVNVDGREHMLVYDSQYHRDIGPMHPDYAMRAAPLLHGEDGRWRIEVLHPVDIAISKIGRFQDHDVRDIQALALTQTFDGRDLRELGAEAIDYQIGNLAFAQANLGDAADLVNEMQRGYRQAGIQAPDHDPGAEGRGR